jgi:hypothetical protein
MAFSARSLTFRPPGDYVGFVVDEVDLQHAQSKCRHSRQEESDDPPVKSDQSITHISVAKFFQEEVSQVRLVEAA